LMSCAGILGVVRGRDHLAKDTQLSRRLVANLLERLVGLCVLIKLPTSWMTLSQG